MYILDNMLIGLVSRITVIFLLTVFGSCGVNSFGMNNDDSFFSKSDIDESEDKNKYQSTENDFYNVFFSNRIDLGTTSILQEPYKIKKFNDIYAQWKYDDITNVESQFNSNLNKFNRNIFNVNKMIENYEENFVKAYRFLTAYQVKIEEKFFDLYDKVENNENKLDYSLPVNRYGYTLYFINNIVLQRLLGEGRGMELLNDASDEEIKNYHTKHCRFAFFFDTTFKTLSKLREEEIKDYKSLVSKNKNLLNIYNGLNSCILNFNSEMNATFSFLQKAFDLKYQEQSFLGSVWEKINPYIRNKKICYKDSHLYIIKKKNDICNIKEKIKEKINKIKDNFGKIFPKNFVSILQHIWDGEKIKEQKDKAKNEIYSQEDEYFEDDDPNNISDNEDKNYNDSIYKLASFTVEKFEIFVSVLQWKPKLSNKPLNIVERIEYLLGNSMFDVNDDIDRDHIPNETNFMREFTDFLINIKCLSGKVSLEQCIFGLDTNVDNLDEDQRTVLNEAKNLLLFIDAIYSYLSSSDVYKMEEKERTDIVKKIIQYLFVQCNEDMLLGKIIDITFEKTFKFINLDWEINNLVKEIQIFRQNKIYYSTPKYVILPWLVANVVAGVGGNNNTWCSLESLEIKNLYIYRSNILFGGIGINYQIPITVGILKEQNLNLHILGINVLSVVFGFIFTLLFNGDGKEKEASSSVEKYIAKKIFGLKVCLQAAFCIFNMQDRHDFICALSEYKNSKSHLCYKYGDWNNIFGHLAATFFLNSIQFLCLDFKVLEYYHISINLGTMFVCLVLGAIKNTSDLIWKYAYENMPKQNDSCVPHKKVVDMYCSCGPDVSHNKVEKTCGICDPDKGQENYKKNKILQKEGELQLVKNPEHNIGGEKYLNMKEIGKIKIEPCIEYYSTGNYGIRDELKNRIGYEYSEIEDV